MQPVNVAHSVARQLVRVRRRPGGPGPPDLRIESPCETCHARSSCRSPCAALEAVIPSAYERSYKEVPSEALTRGFHRAQAGPPNVRDDVDDADHVGISPVWRRPLRRALAQLPDAHRFAVVASCTGTSTPEIARQVRASTQVVRALVHQSLSWLAHELRAEPANDNQPHQQENFMLTSTIDSEP